MRSDQVLTITKILLVLLERTFVSLSLSVLRNSEDFGTHLAYALIVDTVTIVCILLFVDVCIPWAARLRLSRDVPLRVGFEDVE